MFNSFRTSWDEALIININTFEKNNENLSFIIFEDDILKFNEITFYNIEFLEICNDKIHFKYFISSEDQTSYKNEIERVKINGTTYNFKDIKKIEFHNCEFNNINIHQYLSIDKITFNNCYIKGVFDFRNNKNNINFELISSTLEQYLLLNETSLKKINLEFSTFLNYVDFSNTKVKTVFNLINVFFEKTPNFYKIVCDIDNRETARIIKHSFEKQDNIIEANKFYAIEMQKREEELKDKNSLNYNFWDRLVFKIHGISSNHSQDWLLPLLWIFNITMLFTHIEFYSLDYKTEYYTIPLILQFILTFYLVFNFNNTEKILFTIVAYFIYSFISRDFSLCYIVNTFNPFSIMTEKASLTFLELIYKVLIAYLIYQFIISIRQNTRRK